ncbi:fungal-specific transcription factor domain-containing protein [Roridomyces roridus]|uniref:Fungal-specific transcription factor domain-containing protein n=1 Tax=Roridomyces roridus TaxID=1738132 RepID=A0AAD7FXZ5_9AGAR|nr:fungal-specific transcription factor domain-containing protein [Roridomyces roridus]
MSSSAACDACRRRKTRCDGAGPNTRCSRCLEFGLECTHHTPVQQRGPKNKLVEELKKQIEVLEARLRSRLCSQCSRPLDSVHERPESPSIFHGSPESLDSVSATREEDASNELADSFRHISITGLNKSKFFTVGSSFGLLSSAIDEKEKYDGKVVKPAAVRTWELRRRIYWEPLPWEQKLRHESPSYVFPPNDLIDSLIQLYFINVHPTFPVLHRHSFKQSLAEQRQLSDPRFGAVLLAVLAVASRYSDDPRVLIPGETSPLGSGWNFVAQVQITRRFFEPNVHDVQFYCLMAMFAMGTSSPYNIKLYVGLGIYCLEHRNRHPRPKPENGPHTFEDELWNRAFWSVFALDGMMCAFMGCPPLFHVEDFNFDPPLDIDDDYWEKGFTQPIGKPSLLSFFVCYSQLCEIHGDALSRLYAAKKKKTKMGWTGTRWEVDTVAQLDSAMNAFLDSIPSHLRWDPEKSWAEPSFFDQSAVLYASYYHTQITIHRPYIQKENPLTMASLSICTSAARSALCIAHAWINRFQRVALPFLQHSSFVAAIILFLNFYGCKRAGHTEDLKKDFPYTQAAIEIMRCSEARYHQAGRMLEMIQQLFYTDQETDLPINLEPLEGSRPEHLAAETSIEQLLTETSALDTPNVDFGNQFLQDELMGMWTAAPADLMNVNQWGAYMESINMSGGNWAGV